jgi:hypothetical protein
MIQTSLAAALLMGEHGLGGLSENAGEEVRG